MKIFPAIDIFDGKAVRLFKGDYNQMTIYDNDPVNIVKKFHAAGAKNLHLVDLEGAKSGDTPNMDTIKRIIDNRHKKHRNCRKISCHRCKPSYPGYCGCYRP